MNSIQDLLTRRVSLQTEFRTRTITSVCTTLFCNHLMPALTHFKSLSRHCSYTLSLRTFKSYFSLEALSQNIQSIFNACKDSFLPLIDYSNFAITLNDVPDVTFLTKKLKKMTTTIPLTTIVNTCKAALQPFNAEEAIYAMIQHPYTCCAGVAAICDSLVGDLLTIENPVSKEMLRSTITIAVISCLAHGYGVDIAPPLLVYAGYRAIYHIIQRTSEYITRKKLIQLCEKEIIIAVGTTEELPLKELRRIPLNGGKARRAQCGTKL